MCFGQEVDVGSRYGSLLFANTMKMLGTTDGKLKNHLIFRLCHITVIIPQYLSDNNSPDIELFQCFYILYLQLLAYF